MSPQISLINRRACLAVVPAYNESATVGGVVAALHREAPQIDVVVIDDGSTDKTGECAERAGARILRLPFNIGIGGAVQAGFKFAHENDYDYMVQVDGDGQHDPAEIASLFDAMERSGSADMICGSRFLTATGYVIPDQPADGHPPLRLSPLAFLRQRVTDPTSGFRLYNRRAIALFARDYPHDYPEVEAVLMLHHHRLTMQEIPVRMFQRGGGVSSISSGKSFYYMVKVLLALFVGLGARATGSRAGRRRPRSRGAGHLMDNRLQVVAILGALALLLIVLEMVRRRRLMERYALLWLFSAFVILGLAVWQDALNVLARQMGIISAPNALFFVAVGFILLLLLHFSAAMSRLTDQSKVLAQRQAMLEQRLREVELRDRVVRDAQDACCAATGRRRCGTIQPDLVASAQPHERGA